MATQCVGRSSNAKNIGRRSLRKRRESEEENVYIDLNRDHTGLVQEILFYVVKPDVSKHKKLGYLNGFVKLLQSLDSCDMIQYSYKDIFCCLRVSLFHEACEVRAAGLRACRYLIQNVEAAEAFCQMKLHFLAARSLDILLDNRLERIHALRLMRKFLCINPFGFPSSFTNCIIAIVNEGAQERDLVKACLATLAQLTLLNPEACTSANGISVLLLNIIDCQQPQIVEAVLGVILFLFNDPKTRRVLKSDLGLEHFLAPYTDCHYQYPSEIGDSSVNEDREAKLAATKLAVVSLLRSWSGITYLFRTDHREISSLIEMLYLPYSNMQKNIIDLMFEIFDLPVPEWTDDFSVAMLSANPSAVQSSWQLFEGYVVAEGTSVLPYISKNRTNLMDNYFALLLLLFMQEGLLEALAEVIVSAEISLAVRCTVLLGELLHMCNQYLPSDCCHPCNCLPSLILTAASFKSPQQQNQASASLTCLFRIHELKKRGCIANSLVLNNLLHICNPEREKKNFFSATISKAKLYQFIKKDMSEIINQVLKDTLVLSDEHECWDWDLIDCILKNPVDALKKAEDANCRSFIQRLLHYFKPSSKQFSEVKCDDERAPQIIVTSNHFMEYLLEMDEARSQEFLDDFLDDLNNSLLEITTDTVPLDVVLSPSNILSTLSHAFFLLIGKLSSSHKGCKFLDRCGTFQILFRLVSIANVDTYIKLVISTLDFSKEGFSRTVLSKVLTGTSESARLYATNYLRVLLRAGLPNFRKWAIEFLVTQLYDPCSAVSYAAVDILDEACNIKENLETLVSLRPSPLHLGDRGLLLLLRFLSIPSGFHFLRDAKFLDNEIDRWKKIYNLKYVKIIEDLLNEALTRHRRGEDGTYGRRSSDTKLAVNSVFVPHHMYGQLAQHKEGLDVLLNKICLSDVFSSISSPDFSSESQLLHLKAALWAVGHLGSYPLGLPIVIEHGILSQIVQLAAEAPVLSIRGTCFFVLGLLSSTPEGAQSLSEYGWEAVCHNHEKIWLITKDCSSDVLPSRRKWSLNSNECEWPLGGLPYSLSFVVQNDNRNLSASQSSHSLDVDDVKKSNTSSFSSTASVQLPNNKYEICARPRSSSDCQPNWKGAPELLKVEASSWDSLSLKNRKEIVFKERSISSYEMESHLSLDTNISRTNSNESGQSGLTDTSISETNLSDNVLCNNRTFSSQQLKASLNTIPSCTSGNNSLQSSDENDRHPSILRHLSRGHSCYLHSSPVSEDSPVFTFTSVRDAQGYATLKNIQRKRVQSLCIQDSSSYDIADDFANCKFTSVPLSTSPYTTGAQRNISFSQSNTSLKSQQSNQDSELFDKNDHNSSDENNMQYIGLCLPSHSKLIFSVPTETMQSFEGDRLASDDENLGLEFHTICNCLASHSSHGKTGLLQMTIDEEVEETVAVVEENINKENNIKMKGTDKRPDSRSKVTTKIIEDTAERKTLVRKEIVRFVTNLSSSVAVKAAEQGLLSLKQKFPAAFQDVCLYSEICLQMAKYSFRLPARRFLQELFLDISFEQLRWEAETIVGVLNLPHKGGSDA